MEKLVAICHKEQFLLSVIKKLFGNFLEKPVSERENAIWELHTLTGKFYDTKLFQLITQQTKNLEVFDNFLYKVSKDEKQKRKPKIKVRYLVRFVDKKLFFFIKVTPEIGPFIYIHSQKLVMKQNHHFIKVSYPRNKLKHY